MKFCFFEKLFPFIRNDNFTHLYKILPFSTLIWFFILRLQKFFKTTENSSFSAPFCLGYFSGSPIFSFARVRSINYYQDKTGAFSRYLYLYIRLLYIFFSLFLSQDIFQIFAVFTVFITERYSPAIFHLWRIYLEILDFHCSIFRPFDTIFPSSKHFLLSLFSLVYYQNDNWKPP